MATSATKSANSRPEQAQQSATTRHLGGADKQSGGTIQYLRGLEIDRI
jgi:hypothetical protein